MTQILRFASLVPHSTKGVIGLGKLGAKDEPAGKVRIFAMVDP